MAEIVERNGKLICIEENGAEWEHGVVGEVKPEPMPDPMVRIIERQELLEDLMDDIALAVLQSDGAVVNV